MKPFLTSLALLTSLTSISQAQEESVIRINSTVQTYNTRQPWAKTAPKNRRGLASYLGKNQVITTAELVANSANLELETTDGINRIPAKVEFIDYEANLAIVKPINQGLSLDFLKPLEIAEKGKIGSEVSVLQVESSGDPLKTSGIIRGAEVVSSFVPNNFFLNYEIKASMQSAASSYTIPVFQKGKLLGILTSYNSTEQMLDVIAPEIIKAFIEDTKDGDYAGFPTAGIKTASTIDKNFRAWLKLDEKSGGIYITNTVRNSPAKKAGLTKGDVLLAINGKAIDRKGYFTSKQYGKLHWSHLVRAENKMGDTIQVSIVREGKTMELAMKLDPMPEGLIASHSHDKAPKYLVKGGILFQELNQSFLSSFGKDWKSRAPLSLLDVVNHPEEYEKDRKKLIFISGVLPTEATTGYERLRSIVVNKVNGKTIADIESLKAAFDAKQEGIHTIELDDEPKKIFISVEEAKKAEEMLLSRGFPQLYRK